MSEPRRQYSHDIRCRVITKWQKGISSRKIADALEMPRSSVMTSIAHFKKHGCNVVAPRPGRPRLTSTRQDRRIVRAVEGNPFLSAGGLAASLSSELGKPVSRQLVRTRIQAVGLNGRSARKKPYLSKVHRRKRLMYAKKYAGMSEEDWANTLFTDEASVQLHGSSGRVFVWRRPNEAFNAKCVLPTFKSGRQSLMVWSSISASGAGIMHCCEKSVDGEYYRKMLKYDIPLTKQFLGLSKECGEPEETRFVQDNAPAHRAKATKECLEQLKLLDLGHPAQGPHLNPIENLWAVMKTELYKNPATSIADLKVKLKDIWYSIIDDMVKKCVLSMPARLDAVIAAKGGHTKY